MTDQTAQQLRQQIAELVGRYAELELATPQFVPGQHAVPPSGKVIGAPELQAMTEAVLDGWLTTGRFNQAFEKRLARYLGRRGVLTANSGSSANLLAFSALTSPRLGDRAIRKGDEVIGVAAGFPTTVNPILQFGAVPVFVDIEMGTYNINPALIEAAIGPRTKAIMLAHTLGNPFNLKVVRELCDRYGLWLIEDCCDALGATYDGRQVGSFGDLGTLSFYPAHHITMGEGGAVFTDSPLLKRIVESFRDWGRDCYCGPGEDNTCSKRFCWQLGDLPQGYDHKYTYSHLGYNLKITDMQAACALAQMDRVDDFIAARKRNFAWLSDRLAGCTEQLVLPHATPNSDPSWFGFPLTLRDESGTERLDLLRHLDAQNVGTRLLFAGNLTRQPYMKDQQYRVASDLSVTEKVMNDTFWIGLWPGLSENHLEHAARSIETYVRRLR
ncbi:lipopolysaccharide biosynthesis protein RfbH [Pseudomonas peradeniyensis]|uniref:Lipopolysaccharide biosynthesis protein RfbH n=1 Tax=Pseudomonas peradeniyensis TaxID=2745488 RepID=A0ABT2VC43_9PSED|nr:lipopolysaccharide biosynthesis protein RfbH [Pseudomonas peradeniyensis]MCU7239304.1 lipopolysaccharide biosynthesis protein RfbH [Pseudomonas peradeniyensis]